MHTSRYISLLSNQIRRYIEQSRNQSSFTGAQGKALHYILAQPKPVYQKDIEYEFNIRPSSATQLIQGLEKNGYVTRVVDSKDSRLKTILPTQKAMDQKQVVMNSLENLEEQLTQHISQEDLETFCSVAEAMLKNMEESNHESK